MPRSDHLSVIHNLLRYLKGTIGQGILIRPTIVSTKAFVASNRGTYPNTRRSFTGFHSFLVNL